MFRARADLFIAHCGEALGPGASVEDAGQATCELPTVLEPLWRLPWANQQRQLWWWPEGPGNTGLPHRGAAVHWWYHGPAEVGSRPQASMGGMLRTPSGACQLPLAACSMLGRKQNRQ